MTSLCKQDRVQKIHQAFAQEGYQLLTDCDQGYHGIYEYICPNGHRGTVRWSNWRVHGTRCAQCAFLRNASCKRHSYDYIGSCFTKESYKLLTQSYKNNKQKLKYKCPRGHIHTTTFSDWQAGYRCPYCAGNRKESVSVEEAIRIQGYKVLSKYVKSADRMLLECPKGHKYWVKWNNFQQGNRCPKCKNKQSRGEKEIIEHFKGLKPIERERTVIGPKELDVYFPSHSVAIEYCGLYWHSTGGPDVQRHSPSYHRVKLDLCAKQNIRLLTIFEDEWLEHKEVCTSRINNALGLCAGRVYARKCVVKQIDKKTARDFLNRTHLQGSSGCKIAFGLFYENKLVQVMTFGSPARAHTAKGKRVLEMKRLASDLDMVVVGGAGKLFQVGLEYGRKKGYDLIKSYCDLRWGTGDLYEQLGFTKTHETKCTPHYTDFINRWRNQSLAQSKARTGITETEKAIRKQLYKIYDCGHSTWEYVI